MGDLIALRYNRTKSDNIAFMVLTATPTKEILDYVYDVVGFMRQENRVLYIRESLNRPNIFLEVRKKKSFEVFLL
jgi:superfamily II DNA helicase RecQ